MARAAYAGVPLLPRVLAFAVASHHAGLDDWPNLDKRLSGKPLDAPGWERQTEPQPDIRTLLPTQPWYLDETDKGFSNALLIRMLFSCLVDDGFLEIEHFYADANKDPVARGRHRGLSAPQDVLRKYMAGKHTSKPTATNRLPSAMPSQKPACRPESSY